MIVSSKNHNIEVIFDTFIGSRMMGVELLTDWSMTRTSMMKSSHSWFIALSVEYAA